MNELWDIAEKGNRIEFFRYFINFKYNVQVSGIDGKTNNTTLSETVPKQTIPHCRKRFQNKQYHTVRNGSKIQLKNPS
jgi:hypothetical protein